MIFDWHFGYTWLWIDWPGAQFGEVVGFIGLSTITIVLNGLILWSHLLWREKKDYLWPFGAGVITFAAVNVAGIYLHGSLPAPDKKAEVLVVQANISNSDKEYSVYGSNTKNFVINKFFQLTSKALKETPNKPTFALWPETAFPDVFYDAKLSSGAVHFLHEFLVQNQLSLITGGYAYTEGKLSNAMMSLNPNGEMSSTPYSKTHLLAFGEYLPGSTWFPAMKEWVPEIADFARGHGPQILRLGELKLGAQICYEGLFDHFSRGLANQGAQMIVNSTNDSWYPDWNEPFQHLYMTLARAIETRRPLIRSTNTGISTAILASGEILTLSPRDQEWTHVYEIPYLENPPQPAFLTWGFYLFPVILGLSFVGSLIWSLRTWPKKP